MPIRMRARCARPVLAAMLGLSAFCGSAAAETDELRIAQQFGIGYLPLQMADHHKLIQKHAAKQGLGEIKITWSQFGGGSAMNDALLSGNLDLASGGVGPLLTIWDKTKGNLDVKGVACLNSMPLFLTTNNPNVKTIKDFTDKDRIALPAVKVSVQARTLQMAAEQAFGEGQHERLDRLTVSMKHPDGVAAMLSGGSEITAHFTSPPYQYQELQDPKIRRVLSSYEVLGGPATFNCVWARTGFREQNPKLFRAVVEALKEAMAMINADKQAAARVYLDEAGSKLDPEFIAKIVTDPDIVFTVAPQNTMKYAEFMHKVGALKNRPSSWKDYFFPEIHGVSGS